MSLKILLSRLQKIDLLLWSKIYRSTMPLDKKINLLYGIKSDSDRNIILKVLEENYSTKRIPFRNQEWELLLIKNQQK